jgi:hypothetical protein
MFLAWNWYLGALYRDRGTLGMLSRWVWAFAICACMVSQAEANGRSGVIRRASCAVVRYYVAKYSASAAEMWARSHGASDAEIEAARGCIKSPDTETAQAARWYTQ